MKYVVFVVATIWASTLKTGMEGSFYLAIVAAALLLLIKLDDRFREQEKRNGGYRAHLRRSRRDRY